MERKPDRQYKAAKLDSTIDLETELSSSVDNANASGGHPKMTCMAKVKKIVNPPIIAVLIAIPIALIPYVKNTVFLGSGAILHENVMKAIEMFGHASTPVTTCVLGSNLSDGYPSTADISQ